jgi:hypothetical protein
MSTASPGRSVRVCLAAPAAGPRRDLVAFGMVHASVGDIDQHAARHEVLPLDTEFGEAVRVAMSLIVKQLYRLSPWLCGRSRRLGACLARWHDFSLLPRWFDCGFMNVRLYADQTGGWPESMPARSMAEPITSPVRISCAALSTKAGVRWLAAPRSSPAHFDGQRALGGSSRSATGESTSTTGRRLTFRVLRRASSSPPFTWAVAIGRT